jgi:glyoxylase-like metal-dependent hydrolase (beta-lactamase superfamily II)
MTSITVGDVRIDQVIERAGVAVDARYQFPDLSVAEAARQVAAADPRTVDNGQLLLSFHSWVLRVGPTVVLVDPCVGNGKQRLTLPYLHELDTPYLDNLTALGITPEDVDMVISTHQHVDHVGWYTRWDGQAWRPTFPRAVHLLSRTEFEHFDARYRRGETVNHGAHADSVLPVVSAGLARLLGDDELDGYPVAPGMTLRRAPGHTPGSLVVDVRCGDQRALLAGDTIHHVLQVGRPELRNHVDVDPDAARRTRAWVLRTCADEGALLLPGHFPGPGAGRVHGDENGYRFSFIDAAEGGA